MDTKRLSKQKTRVLTERGAGFVDILEVDHTTQARPELATIVQVRA